MAAKDEQNQELPAEFTALRKRAEQLERAASQARRETADLKQVIERQSLLLDNAEAQIWGLTDVATYGAVNEAHARFVGRHKADLEGKNLYERFSREVADVCVAGNREVFEKKKPIHSEEWVENSRGETRLLSITKTPKLDADGNVEYVVCSAQDSTERRRAEDLMEVKRDLGIALGSATNLTQALDLVLDAVLKIEGLDCAGIYLVDPATGALNLAAARGVSETFRSRVSHFAGDTPRAKLVLAGEPTYVHYGGLEGGPVEANVTEGLRAIAVIPVHYEGRVVASLNVASHTVDPVPPRAKVVLESIGSQVGGVIARARAEEALRDSRRDLQTLFDGIRDFLFILDMHGKILHTNPVVRERLGYSPAELAQMESVAELHPHDRRGEAAAIVEDIVARGRTDCPLPLMAKDGALIPVETRVTRGRWSNRDVLFAVSRDVAERKRSEGELRRYRDHLEDMVHARTAELVEANELLEREIAERKRVEDEVRRLNQFLNVVIDNANVWLMVLDGEGRPVIWNKAAEAISGYSRDEATGKGNVWEWLYPDEAYRQEVTDAGLGSMAAGASVEDFETTIRAKDGQIRVMCWHSRGLADVRGASVGLVALGRDVTERRQLEEQLREARKMEAVGRLAGGIAHDFNNLLTGVMGYTDLLLEEVADPGAARDLAEIRKLSNRGADLTRQLLAFSRRQPISPEVLALNTLVGDMCKMLQRLIGEHINLQFLPGTDLGNVRADPSQIEQVIIDLAVNARDAMPQGGKLTIATSNVMLDANYSREQPGVTPSPHIALTVTDTGCGMDQETIRHIFEPFFTTKEVGKGTGLGLATVYGIVKQHGGHIVVDSTPGKGATFRICLPRVGAAPQAEVRHVPDVGPHGSETILVVEDEDAVREITRRFLEEHGYTVLCAGSPNEARDVFAQRGDEVALLLTDVVMPECNGVELHEQLLTLRPSLKVLYMSGYDRGAGVSGRVIGPGSRFIQKPFSAHALAQTVRQTLDTCPAWPR